MDYTKGPWEIRHEFNIKQTGTNRAIATTGVFSSNIDSEKVYQENVANAQLVAAAPDMYEALKAIIESGEIPLCYSDKLVVAAKMALNKAEGKYQPDSGFSESEAK